MYSNAIMSDCGKFRYTLDRVWDSEKPILCFIMLNPSTANKDVNDPTVRECMRLATRWGFGGTHIINLFAFRATKPSAMMAAEDPVGPLNYNYLIHALNHYRLIVLAWGGKGGHLNRDKDVLKIIDRHRASNVLPAVKHMGLTQNGMPRHPLGTFGEVKLLDWTWNGPNQ